MTNKTSQLIQDLRRALLQDEAGLTDAQLVRCFLEDHDGAAFAVLLKRHGPMVWAVCRRLLGHLQDAEDAFQATFLVLVRKAASIRHKERLASWLHGVARQAALQARRTAARRRAREKQVADLPELAAPQQEPCDDVRPLLDHELSRLPERYRVVLLLCDLEGKTRKEAAHQLGLPEGTVASRLTRARALLAGRLARRGLALTGGALAVLLSREAVSAPVPAPLASSTLEATSLTGAGRAGVGGTASAKAAALTEGVLKVMLLKRVKSLLWLLLPAVVGLGGALYLHRMVAAQQGPGGTPPPKAKGPEKPTQAAADEAASTGGKAVEGLRLRLELAAAKRGDKVPACRLILDNVGDRDLNVRLGFSLANGKSHHPDAVRLLAQGEGGKARTLVYAALPGVAGRVDPFVVPLPVGSSYALRCRLEKYADAETGDRIDWTAKEWRITAELLGEAVTRTNADMQGLTLVPYWRGKARSNEVRLRPR